VTIDQNGRNGHGPPDPGGEVPPPFNGGPDLGDLMVVLLASSLAGLRDRLHYDGFEMAAELIADLVEIADDYLTYRAGTPSD
jgi:hypothetical protein